jgi:hypothetical protein
MFLFILFLICSVLAIPALVVTLGLAVVQAHATCVERSLTGFAHGHVIVGLLYAILGGWFLYLACQGIYLACSFFTAVMR